MFAIRCVRRRAAQIRQRRARHGSAGEHGAAVTRIARRNLRDLAYVVGE
jgi:hypothetical protein